MPVGWRSGLAGVGCLLAAGCGGRALPSDGPIFADGSRLKAIWEQAPGAPARWLGWYDTALDTPCTFTYPAAPNLNHLPGDPQYCVPTGASSYWFDDSAPFADAGCTKRVLGTSCGGGYATWHPLNYRPNDCGQAARIFRTGAPVAVTSTYHRDEMGSCAMFNDPPPPGTEWFELGEEIPMETLVSATIEIPTGDGPRIRTTTLRANDGAHMQIAAWDTVRQERVDMTSWGSEGAPDGKWDPVSIAQDSVEETYTYSPVFSDDSCSQWAAAAESCGEVGVASIARVADLGCALGVFRHYEIDAPLDRSSVRTYDPNFMVCGSPSDLPANANVRFFAPGPEIAADSLADARVIEAGQERVRMRLPGSLAGPIDIGTGLLFDGQLGQKCAAGLAADGSLRCLPEMLWSMLYGDPACATSVAPVFPPVGGCPQAAPPSIVSIPQPSTGACAVRNRFRSYPIAGPHAGTVYFMDGSLCLRLTDPGSSTYYDLGPELPPESFVPIATSDHY